MKDDNHLAASQSLQQLYQDSFSSKRHFRLLKICQSLYCTNVCWLFSNAQASHSISTELIRLLGQVQIYAWNHRLSCLVLVYVFSWNDTLSLFFWDLTDFYKCSMQSYLLQQTNSASTFRWDSSPCSQVEVYDTFRQVFLFNGIFSSMLQSFLLPQHVSISHLCFSRLKLQDPSMTLDVLEGLLVCLFSSMLSNIWGLTLSLLFLFRVTLLTHHECHRCFQVIRYMINILRSLVYHWNLPFLLWLSLLEYLS